MRRFLVFSLPLLILAMALFHFALEVLGRTPDPSALSPSGGRELPGWVALATWILESVALSALFLLIYSRNGGRWLSGVLTAWLAWIFRGPLLVVTVAGIAGLPPGPWWGVALGWWVLYTICGLLLALSATVAGLQP